MFHLRYSLMPTTENPEREQYGEALLNCWIDLPTQEAAEAVAEKEIFSTHWEILELESAELVTEKNYSEDEEFLAFYEQAMTDSEVFVYHYSPRYPVYMVIARVEQDSPAETAEAIYFRSGDSLMDADSDIFDPEFWKGAREEQVFAEAQEAIAKEGWKIAEVLDKRPCDPGLLEEDLYEFFDEAEDVGSCLVIVHEQE